MNESVIGVREYRHANLTFVDGRGFEVASGDLVMVETGNTPYLVIVALLAQQILTRPEPAVTGRVVAAAASPEVAGAIAVRDARTLEVARLELGEHVLVLAATWSADLGRVTFVLRGPEGHLSGISARLESCFRAEVRCVRRVSETTDSG